MQRRILNKDPHARITLPSIMEHAWLTQSSLPALHSLSRSDPQAAEATVPISPHELQAAYTTNTSGMEMLFNVGLEERTYEPGEYIVREVTATSCQDSSLLKRITVTFVRGFSNFTLIIVGQFCKNG